MADAREKPQCGENPLIKSSYYSSKVQQIKRVQYTKFTCQNTVKTVQSNCGQQDVLTIKSTLVKPAESFLQISSVKPSQLGLQKQSESAQNSPEILSQTWYAESMLQSKSLWSMLVKQLKITRFLCQEMRPKEIEFPT